MYETTSEEEDDEMLEEGGDDTLQRSNGVVDVEDLGKVMKNMKKAKVCLLLMMPKVGLWRKKMERFAVPKNVNQFSVQYKKFLQSKSFEIYTQGQGP